MRSRLAYICLVYLLLASGCGPTESSPEEVAAGFHNRIGKMDLAGALELVSTRGRQQYGDEEIGRILGILGGLSAFQGGLRVDQVRVASTGPDRASALVTGGYQGDNSNWGILGLVRESDGWKVDIEPFMPLTRGFLHGIDPGLFTPNEVRAA